MTSFLYRSVLLGFPEFLFVALAARGRCALASANFIAFGSDPHFGELAGTAVPRARRVLCQSAKLVLMSLPATCTFPGSGCYSRWRGT